jgi:hypothetical protein
MAFKMSKEVNAKEVICPICGNKFTYGDMVLIKFKAVCKNYKGSLYKGKCGHEFNYK